MERSVVNIIQTRAEAALKAAFASDPMLKHVKVSAVGGKIGNIDAILKFQFLDTSANPLKGYTGEQNEDSIRNGNATAGTVIVFGGKTYTIIRARRSKYEAHSKSEDKVYLVPFEGCRLAPKS